jgi:hypothetical protein
LPATSFPTPISDVGIENDWTETLINVAIQGISVSLIGAGFGVLTIY